MLSFAPPIRLIDGHAVFSDSADARLFYVAPKAPRVAADSAARPLFAMTQYMSLGDESGAGAMWGGFLSLSVNLAVPARESASILTRLRAELGGDVRIAPLPFQDGTVRLMALGQEAAFVAGDQPATPAADPTTSGIFDIDILGSGKPLLDGECRASFQLTLNGKAAAFIEQAMEHPGLPILVNYSMMIEGLRPAFRVKITADWSRVYEELQGKLKANVYYVRADLEKQLKSTFLSANVRVETTVESVDAANDAKEAEKALLDWALNEFFAPSHSQPDAGGRMIDGIVSGVGRLIDSLMPGVSLTLKNLREDEVRTFNAQLDRTVAERRVLTFDGTVGETMSAFRLDDQGREKPEWASLKETFLVLRVNVPDDPRLDVRLTTIDRFASDGVSTVIVDVARKKDGAFVDARQYHFDAAGQSFDYSASLLAEGAAALGAPYYYRVTARFNPASPFGVSDDAAGDWMESRSKTLQVDPRADAPYRLTNVSIFCEAGFPFTQFEDVTLELRVSDPGTQNFAQFSRLVLNKDKTTAFYAFRSKDDCFYDYRLTYRKPQGAGEAIVTDWTRSVLPILTVPNPAAASLRLNILSSLPWDRITFASLELKYDDDDNDIHINEQLGLSAAMPLTQRNYAIAKQDKRGVMYRLTALFANGQFQVGDWRETTDSTLVVGASMVEERHIRIVFRGQSLSKFGLRDIRIDLEAVNDAGVAVHSQTLTSKEGDAAPSWDYPLGEPPARKLRVRARFTAADGISTSTAWQSTERSLLIVDPEHRTVLVEQVG